MSSSTHPCARPTSSSTSPDPSRAPARSSPTRCPRSRPSCCVRRSSVPHERSRAFAPGRVNLIGEHTDYNQGLALPFAIAEGVIVRAAALAAAPVAGSPRADGWRAFVRGVVAELSRAGFPLVAAHLQINGGVPPGAGLSSSAALEVAVSLALIELGSDGPPGRAVETLDRLQIAQLCSRVENDWVGARTGLLDQLASLYGQSDMALCIDFRTLQVEPVPLQLCGWRLAVLDSGDPHEHASSGYNRRRAECARACELLGVDSLREADSHAVA